MDVRREIENILYYYFQYGQSMHVIFALTSQIASLLWPSGLPYYQDSSTQQVRKLNSKQLKEKEYYLIHLGNTRYT